MTVQAAQLGTLDKRPSYSTGTAAVDLYWLPLGAGGHFVRFNGRVYERLRALLDHRRPLDLYDSALEVTVPEGRFVIENSWPIPKASGVTRGVTVEGPVGSRHLCRFRALRYEVRLWREGTIADVDEAVASPQRLSNDEVQARRVLEMAAHFFSPAGFEGFFRELAEAERTGSSMPKAYATVSEKYGITWLGQ